MTRFKNMPGVAWLVIGICVTALVLPSAAYAAGALKFTGIEGTSTHKADVSPDGQLLTTAADPANSISGYEGFSANSGCTTIYAPPTGKAAVITSIHVAGFQGTLPYNQVVLYVGNPCNPTGWGEVIIPSGGNGESDLEYSPGVVIPAGQVIQGYTENQGAYVTVNGYTINGATAPTASPAKPFVLPKPNP